MHPSADLSQSSGIRGIACPHLGFRPSTAENKVSAIAKVKIAKIIMTMVMSESIVTPGSSSASINTLK